MTIDDIKGFLKNYDGEEINIMEVCGSHTAAIASLGIPELLSDKILLISGPGCPVCVTPSSYIDRLIELALTPGYAVVTFGDLMRVPGSEGSLLEARTRGAEVVMVYSPLDTISYAKKSPEKVFVFAAVGFETTAPVYAELVKRITEEDIKNIHLLTAIKTMPPVIRNIIEKGLSDGRCAIDGFLAPGHVSVITGYGVYEEVAKSFGIPFVVAGFTGERLLLAIYDLVKMKDRGEVKNDYPSVVTKEGSAKAGALVKRYFMPHDAVWRGLGRIKDSGLVLKDEFKYLDEGSIYLDNDDKLNNACICDRVLTGQNKPFDCPLFGKVCNPQAPQGACMVSKEGSCNSYYVNRRKR